MKHNCTRNTHYFLHSVCKCFCIFLLLLLSVYFSFFRCSWFSVSSSVFFFRCSIFFFAFYTLDFVTYMFETPFTEISLPSIRNGTYVMYGTYIEPTLLHFCLVACYSVTLSKTVNSLVEKPLLSVVYFGRRPHESGEKKGVSKMSRFVWTWPLGPVN